MLNMQMLSLNEIMNQRYNATHAGQYRLQYMKHACEYLSEQSCEQPLPSTLVMCKGLPLRQKKPVYLTLPSLRKNMLAV